MIWLVFGMVIDNGRNLLCGTTQKLECCSSVWENQVIFMFYDFHMVEFGRFSSGIWVV